MRKFRLPKGPLRATIDDNVVACIRALPKDREWRVVVTRYKKPRSNPANAYYWGCVVAAMQEATGYATDDIHELMCGHAFGWVERRVPKSPRFPSGIECKPLRTTTRDADGNADVLEGQAFAEFVDKAIAFAVSKGIFVPGPETL